MNSANPIMKIKFRNVTGYERVWVEMIGIDWKQSREGDNELLTR